MATTAAGDVCWMRFFRQRERHGVREQRRRHARVMYDIEVNPERVHAAACVLSRQPAISGAHAEQLRLRILRFVARV